MGVHIGIEDKEGNDHPEWDFTRHVGDRVIARLIWDVEHEKWDDWLVRPKDVPGFVKAVRDEVGQTPEGEDINGERWDQLETILGTERWWMQVSY